ncbi:MAG: P1 family peptidase [Acidobacteriota bacterium]
MPKLQKTEKLDYAGGLTDIRGIRVGHFTDSRRPTGCTVVLIEKGAVAGVDVRGSAPGTRETDLLEPRNTVQQVHAVVLSGGSAFGLDSAAGVVQYLEEKGIGYPTRYGPVPIVPAAILYDLGVGDSSIRPDRQAGYHACRSASTGPIEEGNVGAGAGATVGKLLGRERGMKGGLGSASIRVGQLVVAALAAVNASGDVIDPTSGRILAGARSKDGKSFANLAQMLKKTPFFGVRNLKEHTTLGVVATNASFDKAATQKVAQMSHDGLARAINPIHLPVDGDTIFSLSIGELDGSDLGQVGALAAEAITQAVVRAVLQAGGIPGYPAHSDLK